MSDWKIQLTKDGDWHVICNTNGGNVSVRMENIEAIRAAREKKIKKKQKKKIKQDAIIGFHSHQTKHNE